MPTILRYDATEEKHLVEILGVDKTKALEALNVQQGVSIQSVEAFCQRLRFDLVSKSRKALEVSQIEVHFIPYGVVRKKKTKDILVYQRPAAYGVGGLEGKHSVGFAGHVDGPDFCYDQFGQKNAYETCRTSFVREMDEELQYYARSVRQRLIDPVRAKLAETLQHSVMEALAPWATIELCGFIYDTTDEVGQTHLGVFTIMEIDDDLIDDIQPGEDVILNPHWVSLEDAFQASVQGDYNFENWSAFIVQHLLEEKDAQADAGATLGHVERMAPEELADNYALKYHSDEEVLGWVKVIDDDGRIYWQHPDIQAYRQGYLDSIKELRATGFAPV